MKKLLLATALVAISGAAFAQDVVRLGTEGAYPPYNFINDAGDTTVVKAFTRQYEELARNVLGEPVYASPALSGGRLYLRAAKHLFCIE